MLCVIYIYVLFHYVFSIPFTFFFLGGGGGGVGGDLGMGDAPALVDRTFSWRGSQYEPVFAFLSSGVLGGFGM